MEAWHIANDHFRRYSWSLSRSKDTLTDDSSELLESSTSPSGDAEKGQLLLLTLRHSHHPKSSPSRVLFGTLLLGLIVLIVLKMLAMGWHTAMSEE